MQGANKFRRRWFWAGGALLVSMIILCALGVAAVKWEARARSEEQRTRAQQEAERLVDLIWEELRVANQASFAQGMEEFEGEWLPEPGQENEIYERYLAGDYEAVIGAGRGSRTPAGLPVQTLAALHLIRVERDPARLEELCEIAWRAGGLVVPEVMEEAERRHAELQLEIPAILRQWERNWEMKRTGVNLMEELDLAKEMPGVRQGRWFDSRWGVWWVCPWSEEEILMLSEPDVIKAYESAVREVWRPQGTRYETTISGNTMISFSPTTRTLVRAGDEIRVKGMVVSEKMLGWRGRFRGPLLGGVIVLAVAAGLLGLWLAYSAWCRERDYAERQGDFIAAVSHEMRTPLASMRLLAGNLERDVLERTEDKKEHARLILQEMERLSRMVERVLSFARHDSGIEAEAIARIDPLELLERARGPVMPLAEEREVEIELEVDEFSVQPMGEPEILMEALVNLLDNAVKHSPDGKTVRAGAREEKHSWIVWVEDEGEGVAERERERIFEQFYRVGSELRRERPGSGLGLALVRQTAERHGGTVQYLQAAGGGARFEMVLPLKPEQDEKEKSS